MELGIPSQLEKSKSGLKDSGVDGAELKSVHFSLHTDALELSRQCREIYNRLDSFTIWLMVIFFFCFWSNVLATMAGMLEPKNDQDYDFICVKKIMEKTNWTFDLTKRIRAPKKPSEGCLMYDINNGEYMQRSYVTQKREGNNIFPDTNCTKFYYRHGFHLRNVPKMLRCSNVAIIMYYINCLFCISALVASGITADMYGRRIPIIICAVLCILGLFFSIFVTNVWMIFVGTSVAYAAVSSVWQLSFIFFAEVCSVKSRAIWVQLLITGSGVGTLLGVVINYYINQHMHVRAAYTVSSLVLLFGAWYIPESPRWLWANRRFNEATDVFREMGVTDLPNIQHFPLVKRTPSVAYILNIFRSDGLKCRLYCSIICFVAIFASIEDIHTLKNVSLLNNYLVLCSFMFGIAFASLIFLSLLGRKIYLIFSFVFVVISYCFLFSHGEFVNFVSSIMIISVSTSSFNLAMLHTTEMYPVQQIGTILGVCVGSGVVFHLILFSLKHFTAPYNARGTGSSEVTYIIVLKILVNLVGAGVVLALPETTNVIKPLNEQEAIKLKYHWLKRTRQRAGIIN